VKKEVSRQFSLDRYLSNTELLAALGPDARGTFEEFLRMHPRRSASGIVVVTAFSAPFACPHGTCTFCPGGPRMGTPQSYMRDSPGMRTALEAEFDPFLQVRKSLGKYQANGHAVSKVEAIIEGGTFVAVPQDYQLAFVKGVYDGLNGFAAGSLSEAQTANEVASSRCVGLTLESKPDWCRPQDIDLMLEYGITRVEVGVQSLHDEVLKESNRGHTTGDSAEAFRVARDAGLKVTAHIMPGLPGADPAMDLDDLRRLFGDPSFKPDMMKVYPTLVVGGTPLERQHLANLYHPYELDTVVELLSEMKRFVPRWHRIMRIQREIPSYEIVAGVKNGNLRELVLASARQKGRPCACIRCREVALGDPSALGEEDELRFVEERYEASGGEEVFGSFEYEKCGRIAGFFRLRRPSESAHRSEVRGSCIVRELRVYGRAVPVGGKISGAWQHKGLGRSLMEEAERKAQEEFGARTLLVTSAVGTREYYRKLGYQRNGPYMAKTLPR
jgi:elongator complex protein 3